MGLPGTLRPLVTEQRGVAGPWGRGLREEKGHRKGLCRRNPEGPENRQGWLEASATSEESKP